MPATEHAFRARVNVSACQLIAGFAVSINCRFWVSTEGRGGFVTRALAIQFAEEERKVFATVSP